MNEYIFALVDADGVDLTIETVNGRIPAVGYDGEELEIEVNVE